MQIHKVLQLKDALITCFVSYCRHTKMSIIYKRKKMSHLVFCITAVNCASPRSPHWSLTSVVAGRGGMKDKTLGRVLMNEIRVLDRDRHAVSMWGYSNKQAITTPRCVSTFTKVPPTSVCVHAHMWVLMSSCVHVHPGVQGHQKKASDPWDEWFPL